MDYTIEDLRRQFPELTKIEDLTPLFDAAARLWLEQVSQRKTQTNSPITDFENLGRGNYRFVVNGRLAKLKSTLEDKSTYDPDTTLYMTTKLSFGGAGAEVLRRDLGEFVRNCDLDTLEQAASQRFMEYMEIAD